MQFPHDFMHSLPYPNGVMVQFAFALVTFAGAVYAVSSVSAMFRMSSIVH